MHQGAFAAAFANDKRKDDENSGFHIASQGQERPEDLRSGGANPE
jgi:hypothetical protein